MMKSPKPCTVMVLRHAGSHLILPMVKFMVGRGVHRAKGQQALTFEPYGPTIVFVRNPRNRLVSNFRWKFGRWPTDLEIAAFAIGVKAGEEMSPLDFMLAWAERWMRHPGALIVRFEDLSDAVKAPSEIGRIASFIGVHPNVDEVVSAFVGRGTFTGKHSDWKICFGPKAIATYNERRGQEIDRLMGYDNG